MKKSLKIVSVLVLFGFCFTASILFVMWWKTPSFQTYIPPKKTTSTNLVNQVLFNIKSNGKYGCMNKEGKTVIEPKFDNIQCSEDNLIPIEINEKSGFVNQAGEIVLEPQFRLVRTGYSKYFSEDLAVVCVNSKCGFIDSSGNYVIKPKFDYAENFSDGLAMVQIGAYDFLDFRLRDSKTVFINKKGEIQFENEKFIPESKFSNGLAKVSVDGKFGFINTNGKFVINPQELGISDFSEDLAVFSTKNLYRFGYVDKSGKIIISQHFNQAGEFSEGLATVMFENGKYGYIDRNGKTVIEPQFDVADTFYEDRAVVMINSGKGYIDKMGNLIIPIQFGSAERFVNGLARVSFDDENPPYENKKYDYIDKSGNFVLNPTN